MAASRSAEVSVQQEVHVQLADNVAQYMAEVTVTESDRERARSFGTAAAAEAWRRHDDVLDVRVRSNALVITFLNGSRSLVMWARPPGVSRPIVEQ
jgi:hypothetical protein